jgi:hypothetical protein
MRERERARESRIHHSSWKERIACPSLIDGSCSAGSVLFARLSARSFSLLDNLFHTGPRAHTTCSSWRSHSALALSLSLSTLPHTSHLGALKSCAPPCRALNSLCPPCVPNDLIVACVFNLVEYCLLLFELFPQSKQLQWKCWCFN